ncbi:MAG: hypothetical protein J1G06_05185 [Oscillospiraceae bacterium]|nr:hypothetical protein [Oscillospiraceae bacterium]
MSLKLLINKSVIKSDLRRFWYMGALFMAMLLITAVLPAMRYANVYGGLESQVVFSTFMVMLFGIIIPAVIFSYMHGKSSAAMAHSLPLRRECLYLSHILASWLLMLIPLIVTTLIMLTIDGLPRAEVLRWAGHKLIYAFLMTSFGTLSAMLTGNIFASIVLPFIVIILPLYINMIVYMLCMYYLYGFAGNEMSVLFLYSGLKGAMLYIYPTLGIVCYIISFICYKKRAIENHSRLVAFNVLNHIFLYCFALCLGFLGYIYVCAMNRMESQMWVAMPFGIIGIIVARMLINRSFKPGNIIKPVIIYAAMMFVIYAFVGLDITGYEKRVPDIDDIEYAMISEMEHHDPYDMITYSYAAEIAPEADCSNRIYEKDDIGNLIALHEAIASKNDDGDSYIPILYKLKNGHTLKRRYAFNKDDNMSVLYDAVMNTVSVKSERFPVLSSAAKEYTSAQVTVCGANSTNLTNDQIDAIVESIKTDITEANYSDLNDDTLTTIDLTQIMPSVDWEGNPIKDKSKWVSARRTYNIHPVYKRTIALLTEWGLYNNMPSVDEINSIELRALTETDRINTSDDIITVTDKAEIEKLLVYLRDNYDKLQTISYNNAVVTINYINGSAWQAFLEQLPE